MSFQRSSLSCWLTVLGDRALLLVGTAGLAITLAVLGILFSLGAAHLGFLVLIVMLFYIFSFAIGMGPVLLAYEFRSLSHSPARHRRRYLNGGELGGEFAGERDVPLAHCLHRAKLYLLALRCIRRCLVFLLLVPCA